MFGRWLQVVDRPSTCRFRIQAVDRSRPNAKTGQYFRFILSAYVSSSCIFKELLCLQEICSHEHITTATFRLLKYLYDFKAGLGDSITMHLFRALGALAVLTIPAGCTPMAGATYRLYSSSGGNTERVHFASFNSIKPGDFNQKNCAMTLRLLETHLLKVSPMSTVRFWCNRE